MKSPILTYGTHLYDGKRNLIIVLFFSDRCNYNCKYCGNKFPRNNCQLDADYVYDQLVKLLQSINGKIFIEILGGEPTTHPQFYSFCQRLAQIPRFKTSVYTNFSSSTDMYIDLLQKGINIIPSWHSLPHDMRNRQFIDNVTRAAHAISKPLNVRVMYEPYAATQSIEAFNALYAHHNKMNIEFSLLVNSPRFKIDYTDEQMRQYLECQHLVYHENDDIFMKFDDASEKLVGYYDIFRNSNVSFRFWQCNAGMDTLYIHSDGYAYTCPKFFTDGKSPLYNIYDKGIQMVNHPTICSFKKADCECDKEVMKKKVLYG